MVPWINDVWRHAPPVEKVQLLLADSNALFRECLRGLLASSQFEVAREASNLEDALEILKGGRHIAIVILDLNEHPCTVDILELVVLDRQVN